MTQEDKELLLPYLSAALFYKVVVDYAHNAFDVHNGNYIEHGSKCILKCYLLDVFMSPRQNEKGEYIKPYLRPMSSMTEKEKEEMHNLLSPEGTAIYENNGISIPMNHYGDFVPYEFMNRIIQYLLKSHFDFMGLIPKGLAIAVSKENNPYASN